MIYILVISIILLAYIAYKLNKLTLNGAIAAIIVSVAIASAFSYGGLLLLGFFFISANLFSLISNRRENDVSDVVKKGDHRDEWQVFANGAIPACISIAYFFFPSPALLCGFIASIAAVNADTWASEFGVLSKVRPVHLLKWKRVPVGTSGAITALGTSAAIVGSFVIIGIAIFFWGNQFYNSHTLLFALTAAGFIGNLFDTVIGASFQVEYQCHVCGIATEHDIHCEEKCEHVSGVKWMDNDMVNLSCSLIGACLGIIVGLIWL